MVRNTFPRALVTALMLAIAAPSTAAYAVQPFTLPALSEAQLSIGGRSSEVLVVQVLLDHSGHSPGAIDGVMGGNTARAISDFQRSSGLPVNGRLTDELLQRLSTAYSGDVLQRYTITAEDVQGPFVTVPSDMEAQALLETLGYESPAEALAEKFHMAQSFLTALNPGADFASAGSEITVIVPREKGLKGRVTRIEVDKAGSALRAFAADGSLLATYPATIGSSAFPSPDGEMEVITVAAAPTYHFDPKDRNWGPDKKLTIAAGPNNPVGGTWIDLSKAGYGIHGTPDPKLIGKTSSHGCVRLTNWDAEELGKAVSKGTKVQFI